MSIFTERDLTEYTEERRTRRR